MIIVPDRPNLEAPEGSLTAVVRKVFDGDGFLASVWHPIKQGWVERVPFRFAFIDAPEMEQPYGPEAKDYLVRLIGEKSLHLDLIGKESKGYLPVDAYKRLLCMAFLSEQMECGPIHYYLNGKCDAGTVRKARSVTRNIELEMIVNGWAWVVEQYTFDREEEYFEAQAHAQRHKRGLWALDDPEPPWFFKRRQKRRNRASDGQGTLL